MNFRIEWLNCCRVRLSRTRFRVARLRVIRLNALGTVALQAACLLGGSALDAAAQGTGSERPDSGMAQQFQQPIQPLAQCPSEARCSAATVDCFEALLQERQDHPERAAEIDAAIETTFTQTLAVVVMDMVGFSLTTANQGIVPSLAQIYRIRSLTVPLIEAHQGRILKLEADNVYAVFPTPAHALDAMEAVLQRLNQDDLHASIGIGYGDVLVVGERDVFGHEMNLASKLGEDVAVDDDILLTAAAVAALPPTPMEALTVEVSGLSTEFYRVTRPAP